ncbi:hypothetical protein GGX14DRAFT_407915 [Mycena pura]|uniref:Uncharacterized protein n=1 Tax=Mycena pura TaxID=153505 RepID=A0AAD6UUH8_9AGAR|nr:hypothetical protein GGX14DRAFT_407915 [Mycena pura]
MAAQAPVALLCLCFIFFNLFLTFITTPLIGKTCSPKITFGHFTACHRAGLERVSVMPVQYRLDDAQKSAKLLEKADATKTREGGLIINMLQESLSSNSGRHYRKKYPKGKGIAQRGPISGTCQLSWGRFLHVFYGRLQMFGYVARNESNSIASDQSERSTRVGSSKLSLEPISCIRDPHATLRFDNSLLGSSRVELGVCAGLSDLILGRDTGSVFFSTTGLSGASNGYVLNPHSSNFDIG